MSAGVLRPSAVPETDATTRSVRSASELNGYDAQSSSPDRPESRCATATPAATPPRLWPPTAQRVTPGAAATTLAGSPVDRNPMS